MWRLSDRKSKPPTLNCRRATDGSITAKVNAGRGEGKEKGGMKTEKEEQEERRGKNDKRIKGEEE